MDIYVEKQCVEKLKKGELKQFLLLFDAYFDDLYKYVARRVGEGEDAENITRLTFLDALGQARNTSLDVGYAVWLYSLAHPRVFEHIESKGFPETQGVITNDKKIKQYGGGKEVFEKAERMFGKLSMEEREILRLKFFEEISDGGVMEVLGSDEGVIGPKIYRVLKRVHFLLFGDSDGGQGVYFGELSGFLARMRGIEDIKNPEPFKLSLRADVSGRINRRDFAVEAEEVPEKAKKKSVKKASKGSDDPAKIFVEAVRELKEDEKKERMKEERKAERWERFFDFVERWKVGIAVIPVFIFVVIFVWGLSGVVDWRGKDKLIERGYPTICKNDVVFTGNFADGEKRRVNEAVSDRLCDYFAVETMEIIRIAEKEINVLVDADEWFLEYVFVEDSKGWRVKAYERNSYSNG